MKIGISNDALRWFKNEVELKAGDQVRFYVKIYGNSPVQEGFSLAFTVDNQPIDIAVKTEIDGLTFFIEGSDLWFFNGHDLMVEYNNEMDELEFSYIVPEK
ncbi:HesB/YadR/YfhF family protein [Bacillus sp. USDA818B3_A]|uniref:HesB/YadR/YfhF family protein n=1 Tax=Bacillus sp. USDA818B3_A TaxID=2698834 RepID=UPI00136DE8F0|nr:HesB/YadR/YfhF family protein [Bacillus sp. USDA818B3_A]